MSTNKYQIQILQSIVERFPKKSDAISTLSELLNISHDGIYRRINGDTILSVNELCELAQHYNISLDEIIYQNTEKIIFSYNAYNQPIKKFEDYVLQIKTWIEMFIKLPVEDVYYACQEMPVFIYLFFPKLLSFKLYIYGLTTWNIDFLKDKKFSFKLFDPQLLDVAHEVATIYTKLPSTELWNQTILNNTLNQIEYMVEMEYFEHVEDAVKVCDEITEMIQYMQSMAEKGLKFPPGKQPAGDSGSFDLYNNELLSTNNTILGITKIGKVLFTTLQNPNTLMSSEERMCSQIENWFKEIKSNSASISQHSAKKRLQFFNRLHKKVEHTRSFITGI